MTGSKDWMLPEAAVNWLAHRVQPGWTIVELGSGDGSRALAAMVPAGRLVCVEHDTRWLGRCEQAEYIHAPIVDGWYDQQVLAERLPKKMDCVVVDGPPGRIGRFGLFAARELLDPSASLLIDDVHRTEERELALAFQRERQQVLSIHCSPDGRGFATIGWEVP